LKEDTLSIKFFIRAPLYSQQAREQEKYIKKLENKLKVVQEDMEKYKALCRGKKIKIDEAIVSTPIEEDKDISVKSSKANILEDIISNVKIETNSCSNSEDIKSTEEIGESVNSNVKTEVKEERKKEWQNFNAEANAEEMLKTDEEIQNFEQNFEDEMSESDKNEEIKSDLNDSSEREDSLLPTLEEIDILKEISNRYSPGIKLGRKLLLNMKRKEIEDNIKFSPSEKDSFYHKRLDEELNESNSVSNEMNLEDVMIDDE